MDSIVARHESLWWTAHGVILLLVLAHGVILWSSTNYDVTPTSFQLNGIELWLDCNNKNRSIVVSILGSRGGGADVQGDAGNGPLLWPQVCAGGSIKSYQPPPSR